MKRGKVLLASLAFIFCVNFSTQQSEESKVKPTVNFYGTIRDTSGAEYNVDNITISGLYKRIPVYAVPAKATDNPQDNKTLIDLDEEYQIKQMIPHDASVVTFNNRQYVKIEVISRDKEKTKRNYIVEKTRKIYCNEKCDAGPKEKEFSFTALDILTIDGYKSQEEEKSDEKKNDQSLTLTTTRKLIEELEEVSQQIPTDKQSFEANEKKIKGLKNKMLSLLDQLKKTIQALFS